ncbi:hypothetical protein B0H16DRAFT_1470325 [Mycena metata]|uniref:Uncharacterized protein n=1 Tax=Mycena metata TaxID=1033252 RepID=A0AAD7HW84_9AGAR|nr:hypothetical protein B0H16DRAFT_1470325 [Mycena metata]
MSESTDAASASATVSPEPIAGDLTGVCDQHLYGSRLDFLPQHAHTSAELAETNSNEVETASAPIPAYSVHGPRNVADDSRSSAELAKLIRLGHVFSTLQRSRRVAYDVSCTFPPRNPPGTAVRCPACPNFESPEQPLAPTDLDREERFAHADYKTVLHLNERDNIEMPDLVSASNSDDEGDVEMPDLVSASNSDDEGDMLGSEAAVDETFIKRKVWEVNSAFLHLPLKPIPDITEMSTNVPALNLFQGPPTAQQIFLLHEVARAAISDVRSRPRILLHEQRRHARGAFRGILHRQRLKRLTRNTQRVAQTYCHAQCALRWA